MAISCSGFNTIALFSRRIIKIDNALVNASLVFWFCFAEMICSVTWNYPREISKYLIDGRTFWSNWNVPYPGVRTTQKRPPSLEAVSSCLRLNRLAVSLPSPALLLKRAQPKPPYYAGYGLGGEGKSKWVEKIRHRKVFAPFSRPFRLSFAPQPASAPLWVSEDELLPAFNGNGYVIWSWTSINFLSCFNWWANNCVSRPITKHECWPLSSAVATSAESRCVSFVYFHIPSYLKEFLRVTDRCNNYASWRKTFYKYKCAYYHPVAPGGD